MLYEVHFCADTYYEVEADDEDEALDIASEYFQEYIPECEIRELNED